MKKLLLVTLALVLMTGLILVGCTKTTTATTSTTKTTTTTQTTTSQPTKTIKIGASLALNDPMGMASKKWFELFAKIYNDQGGWKIGNEKYKVQMVIYDSQGDQTKTKTNVERLVLEDKVQFILSGSNSSAVDCLVTEPAKVLLFGQDLDGSGVKPENKYFYAADDTFWGRGIDYTIYNDFKQQGAKSIAQVKTDDQMGHYMDMITTGGARAVGLEIKPPVFYDRTTSDFASIATKIKSENPDIVSIIYASPMPNLIAALKDAGFNGFVELSMPVESALQQMKTQVGAEYLEGMEGVLQDPTTSGYLKDPRLLSLVDAYTKEYGGWDVTGIKFGANLFLTFEDFINKAGSTDPDVVKNYIDNKPAPTQTFIGYVTMVPRPDVGNFRTIDCCFSDAIGIIHNGNWDLLKIVPCRDNFIITQKVMNLLDVYKPYWAEHGYPAFPAAEANEGITDWSFLGVPGP